MKCLVVAYIFLCCLVMGCDALAGPNSPCYYQGAYVRCVPASGVNLLTNQTLLLDTTIFVDNKGTDNTWIGNTTNTTLSTGQRDTVIGKSAGAALDDGNNNSLYGYSSGLGMVSGGSNSCYGYESCRGIVNESNNSCFGVQACYSQAANDNTQVGNAAGFNAAAAAETLIGRQAGVNITSGARNTALGYQALLAVDTGTDNIGIGYQSAADAASVGAIVLGRAATATGSNEMVVGSETIPVASYYFGEGETSTTPSTTTVQTTGGSGSNVAGASLNLAAGRGTGSAAGGSINMQTSAAGGSGTTLRSLSTVATFDINGLSFPNQLTSRFYEATGGGTNYVSIGAAAALSGDFALTLPSATDTLVGKATTDTFTNKTIDADGTGNSISNIENADIKAAAAIALNKLAAVTASRALVSDGSGFVSAAAATTTTEIGYVNGVTSAIQTQLDSKFASAGTLGADHGGTGVANNSAATLTRSGNHGLTLTTTGTTSLTLPTSGTVTALGPDISLTAEVSGVLPIANGGSNKALTLASGGLIWGDADSFETGAAGTTSDWALSGGTGAPTFSSTTTTAKTIVVTQPQLIVGSNATNSTNKSSALTATHYTNAEEPVMLIGGSQQSADNFVEVGGGETGVNAATEIRFYTAANNTTVTGTLRMSIETDGAVTIADVGAHGGNVVHTCTRRTQAFTTVTTGTLTCSGGGEIVTGGGCNGNTTLSKSYPSADNAWTCTLSALGNVDAYAICCQY